MPASLSPEEYRAARRKIGNQELVAQLLGVGQPLISKRERGLAPIGAEASLAILVLLDGAMVAKGEFSSALRHAMKSAARERDSIVVRSGRSNAKRLQQVNSHSLLVSKDRKIANLWEAVES